MKRISLLVIVLLFIVVFALKQPSHKTTYNNINPPVILLESTGDSIITKAYNKESDLDDNEIPLLVLDKKSDILQITLSDEFESYVRIGEEYYTYLSNESALIERNEYILSRSGRRVISLPIGRRGDIREEEAFYYISTKESNFVFKVVFKISELEQ